MFVCWSELKGSIYLYLGDSHWNSTCQVVVLGFVGGIDLKKCLNKVTLLILQGVLILVVAATFLKSLIR